MLKITGLLLAVGALASRAGAQSDCSATTRELAALSPRTRLGDLESRGPAAYDVIGDGAACAPRAQPNAGMSGHFGRLPIHAAFQATVIRGEFLGGVADPRDDGPAWSGRGANIFARTGVSLDIGRLHAVAAPQIWYSQNTGFDVFPSADTSRNSLASPWYAAPFSIDLPSRFGVDGITQIDPGESAAWFSAGPLDVGASTSTQRWGPGERGTLLLGADAPGIPRGFLRTRAPVHTPLGSFSANAFAGTLTESRYFERADSMQLRSLIAWNVAWSPNDSSTFVAGIAHASMRLGSRFLRRSTQPLRGPSDQLDEVYAQFRDPLSGIRAWAEVGHSGALPTARQFFTVPYQGIVYIVGLDRGIATRRGTLLLSGEAANLEEPADIRGATHQDFYTSADIPQGWTQRGRVLGYPTGPGSQSQWAASDWIAPAWSFGIFAERVRWNEDAFLRQYLPYPNRHDVTLRVGIRAGAVWHGNELAVEGSTGHRINYLFQNTTYIPGYRTEDVSVPALRFSFTPAAR